MEKMTSHLIGIILSEALKLTKDNRTRAAELLGISRPTLIAKLKKHGPASNTQ